MSGPLGQANPEVLTGEDAHRAAELVLLVAERLADPAAVAMVSGRGQRDQWTATGLARGHSGIASFYGALAWRDARWAAIAHAHVRSAVAAVSSEASAGLAFGPAAVLAAAQTCGAREGDYATLRRDLLGAVSGGLRERLTAFDGQGMVPSAYDLVNGCTGVGRLLLDGLDDGTAIAPDTAETFRSMLRSLVRFAEPTKADGRWRPALWFAHTGYTEVGMAHGVAGPLALLSLAMCRGHEVRGQANTITTVAGWLVSQAQRDVHGPYWPLRIAAPSEGNGNGKSSGAAWCIGTAGVAAALHLAGTALDHPGWRRVAVESLRAVVARPEVDWHLAGPTLCHGQAGVLQSLHRVGTAARDLAVLRGARLLGRRLMESADENAPFVFRHLVPDIGDGVVTDWTAVDVAGLLEGAAGCAAALLSVTPDSLLGPSTPGPATAVAAWDRILLLA